MATAPGEARMQVFCSDGGACKEMLQCLLGVAAGGGCEDHVRLCPFFSKFEWICGLDTAAIVGANGGEGDGSCIANSIRRSTENGCGVAVGSGAVTGEEG